MSQSYKAAKILLSDPNAERPQEISGNIWRAMKKRVQEGRAFLVESAQMVVSDANYVGLVDSFTHGISLAEAIELSGADPIVVRRLYASWKASGHDEAEESPPRVVTFGDHKKSAPAGPNKSYHYKVLGPFVDAYHSFANDFIKLADASPTSPVVQAYAEALADDLRHLSGVFAPLQSLYSRKIPAVEMKGWECSLRKDATTGTTRFVMGLVVDMPEGK